MKLTPNKEEFIKQARKANLVTISTELTMDLDTPVSIYYKLVGEKKGYIMESVDTTQQQFGRHSFIGGDPFIRIQIFANQMLINENGLMKSIIGPPHETKLNVQVKGIIQSAAMMTHQTGRTTEFKIGKDTLRFERQGQDTFAMKVQLLLIAYVV